MEIEKQGLPAAPVIADSDIFVLLRLNVVTQQIEMIFSPQLHPLDILGMTVTAQEVMVKALQDRRAKSSILELPSGARLARGDGN